MGGFFKIGGAVEFQVAYVGKMDSAFQGTDHIWQVIVQVGAVGSGAEGNTVVRVIHHFHHAEDVFLINDDSGEAEYAPGGVIRMNGHVDVVFITGGHDAFQEIFQIGKELFIVNVFIHGEEVFDFSIRSGSQPGMMLPLVSALIEANISSGFSLSTASWVYARTVEPSGRTLASSVLVQSKSGRNCSIPYGYRLTQIFQRGNVVIDIHVPFRRARFLWRRGY